MKKPEDPEQSGKPTAGDVKLQATSEMKKPEDIEQQLKQQLDASVDALPESVTNKLAAARLKAVQAAKAASANRQTSSQSVGHVNDHLSGHLSEKVSPIFGTPSQKAKSWAKPVWAMAASLCVMVPLWYASQNVNEPADSTVLAALDSPLTAQSTTLSALDIMSTLAELDDEEMELLDNLEFALWLSKQEQTSSHG